MKSILGSSLTAALLLLSVPAVFGQVPNPTQVQVQRAGDNPIYRVTINVVERNIKAVNYRVRGGSTKVDFKGTALLPDAKGDASIESKKGLIDVNAEFEKFKAGKHVRSGISDLRTVGNYAGRARNTIWVKSSLRTTTASFT